MMEGTQQCKIKTPLSVFGQLFNYCRLTAPRIRLSIHTLINVSKRLIRYFLIATSCSSLTRFTERLEKFWEERGMGARGTTSELQPPRP